MRAAITSFTEWLWARPLSLQVVFLALPVVLSVIALVLLRRNRTKQGKPAGGGHSAPHVSEKRSYLYVSLWMYWYGFKTDYLGKAVGVVLFVLSVIELGGPLTHLVPEQDMKVRLTTAALLFGTAVLMIWHHHRIEVRTKQYDTLVTSVMLMLEKECAKKSSTPSNDVANILDALVFALEFKKREKGFLNASVLLRTVQDGEPFRLFAQDSSNALPTNVAVDATHSVAGKVVEVEQAAIKGGKDRPRAIVYVPSTEYVHGVLITGEMRQKDQQIFQGTRVVPSAYLPLTGNINEILQCLLCIEIPMEKSECSAVLSLSSRKKDCLGSLDFTAVKVVAALLTQVMNRVEVVKN